MTLKNEIKLDGVHKDLQKVVRAASEIATFDIYVLEGLRTLERQKKLLAERHTLTLKSRHLTGHAVDIAPFIDGEISFAWPSYYPLADIMKACASDLKIPIEWGGDWKRFKDGPHWQLPSDIYKG